jgi:hypothetical protein
LSASSSYNMTYDDVIVNIKMRKNEKANFRSGINFFG